MRNHKNNFVYLKHINDSIIEILNYLDKSNFKAFSQNTWNQSAVMRHLEIIGEAANNIEIEFQKQHAHIPWRVIIGLRNVVVHDYMDIDINIIWQIITQDLKPLQRQVLELLSTESP
ncbi:MAG: HepT-like ribonuclease domain-containing protein [Patescibacteria group bacterium]